MNRTTGAQRYNARMDKIWDRYKQQQNAIQVTFDQAGVLADKATSDALGFGPFTGPVPKGTTVEDIIRVARRAAMIALKLAGSMAVADANDARANDLAAEKALNDHRAWCKSTGNKF